MTVKLQQHNVLKTSGSVVKVGEYQGANFDQVTGKPVPSKFGVFDIERMLANATEPIPIHVDLHGKGIDKRKVVGYAFRVGVSDDKSEIAHNGFVFDLAAQRAIAEGHDEISPEITTVKDANGNIIDRKIDAICFVPHGAIDGNELKYMVEKFSTPEGLNQNSGTNNGTTDAGAGTQPPAFDTNAMVQATAQEVIKAMMPATKAMIDEAVSKVGQSTQAAEVKPPVQDANAGATDTTNSELAALKAQSAAQQQVTDKLLNEKYDDLVDQVKKLGIPDPSKIVTGLPKLQAIETLTGLRASLVQNATLNGVPQGLSGQGTGQKTEAQNFDECMTELGFNSEHYRNMFK